MRDETLHSADLYPDSVFVGMNQPQEEVRPNIISVTFAEDQMGFLAGALAARIQKLKPSVGYARHPALTRCGDIARGFAQGWCLPIN